MQHPTASIQTSPVALSPAQKGPTLYQMHMGQLAANQGSVQSRNLSLTEVAKSGERGHPSSSTMKMLGVGELQQKPPTQQLLQLGQQPTQQQQTFASSPKKSVMLMNQNGLQTCKNPKHNGQGLTYCGSVVTLQEQAQQQNRFTTLSKVKAKEGSSNTVTSICPAQNKDKEERRSSLRTDKQTTQGSSSITYPALQSFLSEHQENYENAVYQQQVMQSPHKLPTQSIIRNKLPNQSELQKVDLKRNSFANFLELQSQQKKYQSNATVNHVPIVVGNTESEGTSLIKSPTIGSPIMQKLRQNEYTYDKRNKFYQNMNGGNDEEKQRFRRNNKSQIVHGKISDDLNQQYQSLLDSSKFNDSGKTPDSRLSGGPGTVQQNRDYKVSQKNKSALNYQSGVAGIKLDEKKVLPQSFNPFQMINKGIPLSKDQNEIKDLIEAIEYSFDPEQRMRMLKLLHEKVKKIQQKLAQNQMKAIQQRRDSSQQFADISVNNMNSEGVSRNQLAPELSKFSPAKHRSVKHQASANKVIGMSDTQLPRSPQVVSGLGNQMNTSEYSRFSQSVEHVQPILPDSQKNIQEFLISGYDSQYRDQLKLMQNGIRGATQSQNVPTPGGTPSLQENGYQTTGTEAILKNNKTAQLIFPDNGRQNLSFQNKQKLNQVSFFTPTSTGQRNVAPQKLPLTQTPLVTPIVLQPQPTSGFNITALKTRQLISNKTGTIPQQTAQQVLAGMPSPMEQQQEMTDYKSNDEQAVMVYRELDERLKEVEPTAPDQMREKFLHVMMRGDLAQSAARHGRGHQQLEDLNQVIAMFAEFLFLNDCRSLGIIPVECNEQAILKILQESGQTPPRLTFEAHKILTFAGVYGGIKIDTLIIEVPLFIFQQTIIEPMFVLFGNKILENLCDKIPASKLNAQNDSTFDVNQVGSNTWGPSSALSSYVDFPTIEDTMTVYGRLKQYGLLDKAKTPQRRHSAVSHGEVDSTPTSNKSKLAINNQNSQMDVKSIVQENIVKTRTAAGGMGSTQKAIKKASQHINLPALKKRLSVKITEGPSLSGSPSGLDTRILPQNGESQSMLEYSASEANPFLSARQKEQLSPKSNTQVSGVSINQLRQSQKFKKMMKHNWDRIFTVIGIQGNPLAKAFRFGCIVKHSELYEHLKLAYKSEQEQIKAMITNDLNLPGDDILISEELRPIVRTVDTSILDLLTFANNIGLLRSPELVKYDGNVTAQAVDEDKGTTETQRIVLNSAPNIRQIALVVRENAKRNYEPIQRAVNGQLTTQEMKDSMKKLQTQIGQYPYKKESCPSDAGQSKFNKSPSFQQIQQIGMPNSMVPNGLNQRKAFFRHLSVIHALQSGPLVNHTNTLQNNLLGRQMMDQLTITPAQQSFKRLFEIQELERLNTQLLATHMRTIKRQCSIFKTTGGLDPESTTFQALSKKKDSTPGNRKSNLPLKSSTSIASDKQFQAKANEAADFIKDKRMQIIQEKSNMEVTKKVQKDDDTAKIQIVHKPYTHLQKHPVNRMLRTYNEFIMLTFRTKDFHRDIDIPFYNRLQGLAKKIGLTLPPRRFITMDAFRPGSRQAMQFKEILWYYMTNVLNESNGIPPFLVMKDPTMAAKLAEDKNELTHFNKRLSAAPDNGAVTNPPLYVSAAAREGAAPPTVNSDGFYSSSHHFNTNEAKKGIVAGARDVDKHYQSDGPQIQPLSAVANAPFQSLYFRYKIGKGNNSTLVRTIMKNRSWWYASESSTFAATRQQEYIEAEESKGYFGDINFLWTQWRRAKFVDQLKTRQEFNRIPDGSATGTLWFQSMYNRLEHNFHLSNKKCLFYNMKMYYTAMGQDPFEALPLTFHLNKDATNDDPAFQEFLVKHEECEKDAAMATIELKRIVAERKEKAAEGRRKRREERKKKQLEVKKTGKPEQKYAKGKKRLGKKSYEEEEWDESYEEEEYYDECDEFRDVDFSLPQERELAGRTKNIWILKPGENSNRGHGINVAQGLKEVKSLIGDYRRQQQTVIIQKYIANPLLIHKRKFDIRVFTLVTSHFGCMKAYFYKDGYLRTSCKEYNLTNLHSRMVHLTNDAVQQNSEDYGRYEPGNKLSYSDFQKYLNKDYKDLCVDFERDLVPQIQKLITDTIRATFHKIDSKRRINSFEIFGYDFMIDDNFKLYIIECNTNPCLELSAPLLGKLIPQMLDNAFRIAIDPLFMPAKGFTAKKGSIGADTTPENRFELIFDEAVDRPQLMHLFENSGMKGNDAAFDVSDEENEDEKEEEEPHQ